MTAVKIIIKADNKAQSFLMLLSPKLAFIEKKAFPHYDTVTCITTLNIGRFATGSYDGALKIWKS